MNKKMMSDENSKVKQKTYFWNTLSGLVNASEAVIILAVVNRVFGGIEAGILTLAFSVSNLSMSIGKYGMRTLQVTDSQNEYSFANYFSSRIYTIFIMFIFFFLYLFISAKINNYSNYKCEIIFLLFLLYSIEVFEDVFLSECQKLGRLDLGAKMFSIRWIVSIFVFCVLCIFFDLRVAIFISIISSFIILFLFLMCNNRTLNLKIKKTELLKNNSKVFNLIINATPLFISSFAYLYINNIQKFAIDKYLSDIEQAAFGYIAMPVFVIPLLSSFVIQPSLVSLTNDYNNTHYKSFNKSIKVNIIFVFIMTLLCEVGAFLLGIPVLNLIYKSDLNVYRIDLLILLLGGSCLALANFMSILLTIMRLQKISMFIYLCSSIVGTITSYIFTEKRGIRGASVSYVFTMLVCFTVFTIAFLNCYKKKNLKRM